ncbi:hypothetical protein QR98_0077030 [Sarcoptes scabiei]|uniref:Uncharacterized protein n=1 Tax=Sarcoptes scabiei TaxID=52283 RepID=A0A132AFG1_SARSC|nr:hypothetical protein QR98_0077030 [Sarcoptes scabiei]
MAFDGAVTVTNFPFYVEFSKSILNPGGCPVRVTYFVSHVDTNYRFVNELYRLGNEVGVHSITESKNSRKEYWEKLDFDGWREEMSGQKKILVKYAKIPPHSIQGARAPDLQTAGNVTYQALKDAEFSYDCSNPSRRGIETPFFPYTLDYGFQQDCQVRPCLKANQYFPGFWDLPMNDWIVNYTVEGESVLRECATASACLLFNEDGSVNYHPTADQIYDLFMYNFERYYYGNRAMFPLYLNEEWMHDEQKRLGLKKFMEKVLKRDDVFFVTIQEGLRWMRKPFNAKDYLEKQRKCKPLLRSRCGKADVNDVEASDHRCRFLHIGELNGLNKDMFICDGIHCPQQYPWLGRIE